ncbi:MAG: medium chain dehydrogenase/reductase family protein [Bdellovibrionota bacterium]
MKQIWTTRTGTPNEALEMRESPDPTPKPNEIRIRVAASGINFADIMARLGLYPDSPKLPAVLGYEAAGTIDLVGSQTSRFKPGQRVVSICRFGGYSDVVTVPEDQVFALPDSLDFEKAAAIPVNYLTAYQAMVVMGGLKKGDTVLVHSAGGGVGLAALDLAKYLGATFIGTASAGKHAALTARGADFLIDYQSEDFEKQTLEFTKGKGVDLILDAVGGDSWEKGLRCLAPGGRLVVFGMSSAATGKRPNRLGALGKVLSVPWTKFNPIYLMNHNIGVLGVNLGHLWHRSDLVRKWGEDLLNLYKEGHLHPTVAHSFAFSEAAAAHDYIQDRKNFGKVLLKP